MHLIISKRGATMSKFEAAKQRFDSPPGSGAFSQRFHATQAMFDDLHENLRAETRCAFTELSHPFPMAPVPPWKGAFSRDFVPVLVWRSTAVRTPVQFNIDIIDCHRPCPERFEMDPAQSAVTWMGPGRLVWGPFFDVFWTLLYHLLDEAF